jgi:hypothetical protein
MIAFVTALTGAAHAESGPGAWYVSPLAQWWELDKSRQSANHVAGELSIGYRFDDELALEVEGGGASFAASCGCALTLRKLSVDVLQGFPSYKSWHPYIIAGVGGIEDREDALPKTNAVALEAGAGTLYALGAPEADTGHFSAAHWQLRGEIKYQHEFNDTTATKNSVGDIVYGIGVQYSF